GERRRLSDARRSADRAGARAARGKAAAADGHLTMQSSVTGRQSPVGSLQSRLTIGDWRLTTAASLAFLLLSNVPVRAALTSPKGLATVYDTILAAQFDRVDAQLKQACPPAPAEACQSLAVVAIWWQIQ